MTNEIQNQNNKFDIWACNFGFGRKIIRITLLAIFTLVFFIPNQAQTANKPLKVPYTTQIPIGYWANPWSNACEESSVKMVEEFYKGRTGKIAKQTAINMIRPFFSWENSVFGENYDSNSYRTLKMINEKTLFTGEILRNPTIQQIKDYIKLGLPVISLHYGFDLPNKNPIWG